MKRISLVIVAALTLALLVYAHSRTPKSSCQTYESLSPAKIAASRNRVNGYFENKVVAPKLKNCWSRLQGEGMIAMDLTYRKSGGGWTFEKVALTKSTLSGQDAAALQCMQEALSATSFSVDTGDGRESAAEEFVLRWVWPVPLPTNGSQVAARMSGSGGLGDVQGCSDCVTRTEYPYGLKCVAKKSGGYINCQEQGTNTCSYGPSTCLTGTYGMGGRSVIY